MSASPSLVRIDYRAFRRTRSGTVIAGIWLDIGGAAFPAEMWDDFATAFLVALGEALLRLWKGESRHEDVYFYDGPYTVEMERIDVSRLEVSGLRDDRLMTPEHTSLFWKRPRRLLMQASDCLSGAKLPDGSQPKRKDCKNWCSA